MNYLYANLKKMRGHRCKYFFVEHTHNTIILQYTRVIFYVRRIGRYLYKYRIYGTISIYFFERSSFCLSTDINFTSLALSSVKIYSFELGLERTLVEIHAILTTQLAGNKTLLSSIRYGDFSNLQADFSFAPSKLIIHTLIVVKCSKTLSLLFALL